MLTLKYWHRIYMKPLISILLLFAISAHAWKLSLKPETISKIKLGICKLRNFCFPVKWQVCAHDDQLGNRIFYNYCYMKQHNACYKTDYFVLDLFEVNFMEHPEICGRWKYKFRKREKPRDVPPHRFPMKLRNNTFH